MGEQHVPPGELPLEDWREALSTIARNARGVFLQHGWIQDERIQIVPLGPNGMRHIDQSLGAAAATGLPVDRQMELIGQLDDYVMGFVMGERQMMQTDALDQFVTQMEPLTKYMEERLVTGEYPHLERFIGGDDLPTVVRRVFEGTSRDERFERGLRRLLDGVEREIEREADGA